MTIKVLVVDATAHVEKLTKQTLLPLGCQVITASSTALGLFLARKNRPCLIVNGVSAKDEMDLPQEIALDAELEDIPVIVVVAPAGEQAASSTVAAVKTLGYPITPERFFEEIRGYLSDSPDTEYANSDHSTQ